MTFVLKFDGRKEIFKKQKVYDTALRMGLSKEDANEVANNVEMKVFDGMQTKKILQLIFYFAKEFKPEVKHRIDLREAISLMRSKPDFETFVTMLLKEEGYTVVHNQIISGACVDHEIDDVAKKGSDTIYVEVKHHIQYHTFTGVGVFLEVQATFEDLKEGFRNKKNKYDFSQRLVVCNTKMSEHARKYAECKGMDFIAWKDPLDNGLEKKIENYKFYPITLLKNLDAKTEAQLGDAGIVLLRQLVRMNPKEIARMTRISANKISDLASRAEKILEI